MPLTVYAPVSGTIVRIDDVPDPVFSRSMIGSGRAIDPFPGGLTVLAPCGGLVRKATPHGYVVEADAGVSVLVHLGIDTVKLKGVGFTPLVRERQRIDARQPIAVWNALLARDAGHSLCTPVVAMGVESERISLAAEGKVEAGKPFFRIHDAA